MPLLMAGAFSAWLWVGLTAQTSGLEAIPPGMNTDHRHQRLLQTRTDVWIEVTRQANPIRISRAQIQTVIAYDIARINEDKRAGQVVQAIAVQLNAGRLRTTTRLNLKAIEVSEMNGSSRVALLRLLKRLPLLSQESLVVAIEGDPVIWDYKNIGLDQVLIQVGSFRWTIAEASRYLQVPESYIEDIIRHELFLLPMDFGSIAVEADTLVITGNRTAW
jgi:hypothetical protein